MPPPVPPSVPDAAPSGVPIEDWCYVRTGLVWAGQWEVEPRYLDAPFQADHRLRAWWIRRGGLTLTAGGVSVEAGERQWIFPGLTEGWQHFLPGSEVLSISFFAEWPSGQSLFDHQKAVVFPAAEERRLTRAAQALVPKVRHVSGKRGFVLLSQSVATVESYFGIRRAFEDWLSAYVAMMRARGYEPSVGAAADPRTIRAARLVDNQPLHVPLRESELARGAGLSVSQLNRLFLRDWGVSPRKYREQQQIAKATALLQLHGRSVKEVAYTLGFRSLPHFSAWFRRLKGESPRAFQKTHPVGGGA